MKIQIKHVNSHIPKVISFYFTSFNFEMCVHYPTLVKIINITTSEIFKKLMKILNLGFKGLCHNTNAIVHFQRHFILIN
jgi:hypothetical protein